MTRCIINIVIAMFQRSTSAFEAPSMYSLKHSIEEENLPKNNFGHPISNYYKRQHLSSWATLQTTTKIPCSSQATHWRAFTRHKNQSQAMISSKLHSYATVSCFPPFILVLLPWSKTIKMFVTSHHIVIIAMSNIWKTHYRLIFDQASFTPAAVLDSI